MPSWSQFNTNPDPHKRQCSAHWCFSCSRLMVLDVRGNSAVFLKAEISVDISFFSGLASFGRDGCGELHGEDAQKLPVLLIGCLLANSVRGTIRFCRGRPAGKATFSRLLAVQICLPVFLCNLWMPLLFCFVLLSLHEPSHCEINHCIVKLCQNALCFHMSGWHQDQEPGYIPADRAGCTRRISTLSIAENHLD